MQPSATQKLQFHLRRLRESGQPIALPGRTRWRDGVPLWSEMITCSATEVLALRERAELVHLLDAQPPTLGLAITPEHEQQGRQLALDVDGSGYGGLVRFVDLATRDNYLRVLVGEGLFPLIVDEGRLLDFWLQLTLGCERHFLVIADSRRCYGYWESDLAFNPEEPG
jgi:hypothetical protein